MMGVPLFAALLLLVCVCVSESCSCHPGYPQEFFCQSDLVMQVNVIGETIIPDPEHMEDGMGEIQYDINVIKVFKGPDTANQIHHVYTREMSSMCGSRLDHTQYLLSGHIISDRFYITMCDFVMRWDALSPTQKNNFRYRYRMGCDCKISVCDAHPCRVSSRSGCMLPFWPSSWSQMLLELACVRHSNGFCGWFKETAKPPGN